MLKQCKFCLEEKKLCKAHILPKCLYGNLLDGTAKIISGSMPYSKQSPNGIYDPNILCSKCDNYFGMFDDFAKKFFETDLNIKKLNPIFDKSEIIAYRVRSVSSEKIKKILLFFVSFMFRCHISNHESVKEIDLGDKFFKNSLNVLKNESFEEFKEFEVVIRYLDNKKYDEVFIPHKLKRENLNCYEIIFLNFLITIKIDQRKFKNDVALSSDKDYSNGIYLLANNYNNTNYKNYIKENILRLNKR
ncbi:hypothetical protein L3V83_11965 [Thiotrichales bacterium 19X7-9]|nr:hypothetical protein [Thiotrichales bacterium 19X7-9]